MKAGRGLDDISPTYHECLDRTGRAHTVSARCWRSGREGACRARGDSLAGRNIGSILIRVKLASSADAIHDDTAWTGHVFACVASAEWCAGRLQQALESFYY